MKYQYTLITVFCLGIAAIIGMLLEGTRHEKVIVGTWKEVTWIYEGEKNPGVEVRRHALERLNESLGHEFFVHENETWSFSEGGKLITHDNYNKEDLTNDINLDYVIKGRGNILLLKYGDNRLESYNITRLNKDTLVLNFALDVQAKGVAELVFARVTD